MKKMKKSKTKERSQRAIEQEEERLAIIEKERQRLEKQQISRNRMISSILCYYGLSFAILSILVDFMGLFALSAIILGCIGIFLKNKENPAAREILFSKIGIGIAAVRLIYDIVRLIMSLQG